MFATFWPQIMIGPFLRREADWRIYHNLFKKRPHEIGFLKQLLIRSSAIKIPETSVKIPDIKSSKRNIIVLFEGFRDFFKPLNGWNEFILQEIRNMTRTQWLKEVDKISSLPIAIHIRLGDFRNAKKKEDFIFSGMLRTPISWFIESLEYIRRIAGFPLKTYIVSNGKREEFKELLSLKNVFFLNNRSAIVDLLILSRAKILIGSGGSSFSAWAAFLGQMPTITYPGQSLTWFNLTNKNGFYLGELDPRLPSPLFTQQIKDIAHLLKKD